MRNEKVYRTELSPVSFLERSASIFAEKTAVVHGDRRYSYREFAGRVNRLASAFNSFFEEETVSSPGTRSCSLACSEGR